VKACGAGAFCAKQAVSIKNVAAKRTCPNSQGSDCAIDPSTIFWLIEDFSFGYLVDS
jgi:hypothetical protein